MAQPLHNYKALSIAKASGHFINSFTKETFLESKAGKIIVALLMLLLIANAASASSLPIEGCAVQLSYKITTIPCIGSSSGVIELTASKGTAPYQYSLDGGVTYQSIHVFTGLTAGSYKAHIKDATGCISEAQSINLPEFPSLANVTINLPTSTVCIDVAVLTLSGGAPAGGYFYGPSIMRGKYFYPSKAGLGTHTIYYTYTNSNGCTSIASQKLTVHAASVVSAGSDQTINNGYSSSNCATLTAASSVSDVNFSYLWSNGATTQAIEVCPEETTSYTVTATDPSGCSSTDEVTVYVFDYRCGKKLDKISVCHNGKPLCIAPEAVDAHLAHGDALGDCTTDGKIKAESAANAEAATTQEMSVYPNPMGAKAQLTLKLQEQDYVTLEILDMNGKVVKKLYKGAAAANKEQSFEIRRSIGNQKMYIARLTTTKGTQFIKIIQAE